MMKRRMLRQNTITDNQYSQRPLYGKLCRRIDTIPVPMHTENHLVSMSKACLDGGVLEGYDSWRTYEGVKFSAIRLHPLWFFACNRCSRTSLVC
jgi:hypothetical protein